MDFIRKLRRDRGACRRAVRSPCSNISRIDIPFRAEYSLTWRKSVSGISTVVFMRTGYHKYGIENIYLLSEYKLRRERDKVLLIESKWSKLRCTAGNCRQNDRELLLGGGGGWRGGLKTCADFGHTPAEASAVLSNAQEPGPPQAVETGHWPASSKSTFSLS